MRSYQPIVALDKRAGMEFEALVRWNRPGHGLVAPNDFIPVAETSSLICDLGRWALLQAAGQLAAWVHDGLGNGGPLRVAVNISARHASSPEIVDDVAAALAVADIAPDQLEVELTETALEDDRAVRVQLARVRDLGVCVSIDDFGTGFTSIGGIAHLPADRLKIDRSFITAPDPRQQSLVKLMIEAAHAFELQVVAEGIEDQSLLDALRDLGCDLAQGYLMARPMPAAQVPAWVAQWRGTTAMTAIA